MGNHLLDLRTGRRHQGVPLLRYLAVRNWEKFQHYKDRSPPWIKLHRTLLDDYEFSALPDDTKAHLMLIWVLASQLSGRVPAEPKFLAAKIGANKPPNLKLLIDQGFLIQEQDASNTLAECKQDASEPLAFARSREERRGEAEESAPARATIAEPTSQHRALAASLGLNCDGEWASFNDRVIAKGKAWFTPAGKGAAFSNWLRQERKYAERDGRVPVANPEVKRVAM